MLIAIAKNTKFCWTGTPFTYLVGYEVCKETVCGKFGARQATQMDAVLRVNCVLDC